MRSSQKLEKIGLYQLSFGLSLMNLVVQIVKEPWDLERSISIF